MNLIEQNIYQLRIIFLNSSCDPWLAKTAWNKSYAYALLDCGTWCDAPFTKTNDTPLYNWIKPACCSLTNHGVLIY